MCDKKHYDELEERVTALESEVNQLRNETRTGFAAINASIVTLTQNLANMDKRIIEEKQKWGDILRNCVKWVVRGLVTVAVYAAGVNLTKDFVLKLF